ncbi:MAG: flagellar motor protein MotA, partial [Acidobacteria bacterium]|nr:flagellar motor protein MotA [Acidobacteriota bacterium]
MTILATLLGTKALGFLAILWQEAAASPAASPAADTNQFTITEMLKHLGGVALGVVIILLIMSVYSIAIMVERFLTYRAAKQQSRQFAPRV